MYAVILLVTNLARNYFEVQLAKRERLHVRERLVHHGHGKKATQERLRTELVGIEGLTTYDSYGEPEQTQYAPARV